MELAWGKDILARGMNEPAPISPADTAEKHSVHSTGSSDRMYAMVFCGVGSGNWGWLVPLARMAIFSASEWCDFYVMGQTPSEV